MRLLHTSDVHLDGAGCLCPLLLLETQVATIRPDAVLIPGDLFDHGRIPEPRMDQVLRRLGSMGPPVVVIPGNHDVHEDDGVYRRHEELVDDSPVTFLGEPDGSMVHLFEGRLALWGRAMTAHEPEYRPLVDPPPRPEGVEFYVVMGHGHHMPGGEDDPEYRMRSSPILPADISATKADYVALGHWHTTTDVSVDGITAWYSGSPLMPWRDGEILQVDLARASTTITRHEVGRPTRSCGEDRCPY